MGKEGDIQAVTDSHTAELNEEDLKHFIVPTNVLKYKLYSH